jgi:hypothetical protein
VTAATPLGILKQQGYQALVDSFGGQMEMYQALFIGNRGGSLGENIINPSHPWRPGAHSKEIHKMAGPGCNDRNSGASCMDIRR